MPDFNKTWTFLGRLSKNTEISNFMKIRPVGTELLRADGRTDMMKPIVAFPNFVKAPKNKFTGRIEKAT
jgi:hypothetical protein